jgi:hypothetical protein
MSLDRDRVPTGTEPSMATLAANGKRYTPVGLQEARGSVTTSFSTKTTPKVRPSSAVSPSVPAHYHPDFGDPFDMRETARQA